MTKLNLSFAQKGVAYFPDFAIYGTYYVQTYNLATHGLWQTLAGELEKFSKSTNYNTVVLLGVGFELWQAWSKELGYSLPQGMGTKHTLDEFPRSLETPAAIYGSTSSRIRKKTLTMHIR